MPYLDTLNAKFAGAFTTSTFRDNARVLVDAERAPAVLFDLLKCLKNECGFDFLAELGGIDYMGYPNRDRPLPVSSMVSPTSQPANACG